MNYLNIKDIIERNWGNLGFNLRFEYLHLQINRLLNFIINLNVLDKKSKLIIPIEKSAYKFKVAPIYINYLEKLLYLINKTTDKSYKLSSNISSLRNFIIEVLRIRAIVLDNLHKYVTPTSYLIQAKRYNDILYSRLGLNEICMFYKKVREIEGVKEVFIQGSLSTLDYTKFSDFDTFVIISKEAEENVDLFIDTIHELFKASVYFYRFDPYQHHRYFACLETDLKVYNQSFLPTKVLDYATFIKGEGKNLVFYTYDSKFSHIIYLTYVLNYLITQYRNNFIEIENLWNLKYFLATIFFIPVLYLETKGIYVYKRDSFSLIKEFLPKDLQNYLEKCSHLRKIWNYKLNMKEKFFRKIFLSIYPNSLLYEYVMRKYSQKIKKEKFNFIFLGSTSYAKFFYEQIKRNYSKEFNIHVE